MCANELVLQRLQCTIFSSTLYSPAHTRSMTLTYKTNTRHEQLMCSFRQYLYS